MLGKAALQADLGKAHQLSIHFGQLIDPVRIGQFSRYRAFFQTFGQKSGKV